ncbi:MAG: class I SAM-dependent methyltransferase [Myxococcota bacterium]
MTPETYAAWRATPLGATTERLEHAVLVDLLGDPTGLDVLDIGCGDGEWALLLARRGARVSAIDVSPAMVESARARFAGAGFDADVRLADAEDLPFPAASFDRVSIVTALCFVDHPEVAAREAARVLRPGGLLVVGELGRFSSWAMRRRVRGWLGDATWRNARFWSAGELRRLTSSAGLVPERRGTAIYFPHSDQAARRFERLDAAVGRLLGQVGAAFVAVSARRPTA